MQERRIAVVKLSDSFSDFWNQFARELNVEVVTLDGTEPFAFTGTFAAILLASGGAESEAGAWLQSHKVPAGTPVFAVGADPGRRVAIRLMSRGLTDYFRYMRLCPPPRYRDVIRP